MRRMFSVCVVFGVRVLCLVCLGSGVFVVCLCLVFGVRAHFVTSGELSHITND